MARTASPSSHLALNAFQHRLRPVPPEYDSSQDAYQSLREVLRSEETKRSRLSRLVRSGVLFVILFEMGSVLEISLPSTVQAATVYPFELFNLVAGAACLYITWTVWFRNNWRLLVFGFCGLIFASASYLSLCSGQTEPLLMSALLLLVAGGSLMPWSARWQGALTLVCLSWFGINTVWSASPFATGLYEWMGLLGASALAYSGAQLGGRYRAELGKQLDLLRTSQSRLRAEFVNYIGLVERAGFHIDHQHADKLIMGTENRSRPFSVTSKRNLSLRNKLLHPISGDTLQLDHVNAARL